MLESLCACCCRTLLRGCGLAAPLGVTALLRVGVMQSQRTAVLMVIFVMAVVLAISSYNGLIPGYVSFMSTSPALVATFQQAQPFFTTKAKPKVSTTHRPSTVSGVAVVHAAERANFTFGIVFDAGSTGSRIHVFKLQLGTPGEPMKLIDELFLTDKPGLSAYAENPKKAADSLISMLDRAKQFIPRHQWSDTKMSLKATAGLRALPSSTSDAILHEINELFKKYPFKLAADSVRIMEGNDEGIFSWFTVNFLNGQLGVADKMVGVIDLGGGSAQLTFVPTQQETIQNAPKDFLTDINLFGKKFKLYTHSYMGLGLMSGRLQTLGGKTSAESKTADDLRLKSECFSPDYNGTWNHSGQEYAVSGVPSTPKTRFNTCYNAAKTVAVSGKLDQSGEMRKHPFCLISYYYDTAVDAKLIVESKLVRDKEKGGTLKVDDFFKTAVTECKGVNKLHPFLCLDLCYVSALLIDGFGFTKDTTIQLRKRIKGTEISWALGAMFSMLNTQQGSHPADGG